MGNHVTSFRWLLKEYFADLGRLPHYSRKSEVSQIFGGLGSALLIASQILVYWGFKFAWHPAFFILLAPLLFMVWSALTHLSFSSPMIYLLPLSCEQRYLMRKRALLPKVFVPTLFALIWLSLFSGFFSGYPLLIPGVVLTVFFCSFLISAFAPAFGSAQYPLLYLGLVLSLLELPLIPGSQELAAGSWQLLPVFLLLILGLIPLSIYALRLYDRLCRADYEAAFSGKEKT